MIDTLEHWIVGLMRENNNELGFIPSTTLTTRYLSNGRYILQHDERGKRVGYLLHGALHYARPLVVSQHCIQYERRLRGYGELAVRELVRRATMANASCIKLRCATELPSVAFWQAQGFSVVRVVPGGKARNRMIAEMVLPLNAPLLQLEACNLTAFRLQ